MHACNCWQYFTINKEVYHTLAILNLFMYVHIHVFLYLEDADFRQSGRSSLMSAQT